MPLFDGVEVKYFHSPVFMAGSEYWLSSSRSTGRHELPEIQAGTAPVNWATFRSSCIFPNNSLLSEHLRELQCPSLYKNMPIIQ